MKFTGEFPSLRCAVCSASDPNGPRRIVVCGRHPDGSIIMPEPAEAAAPTAAESVLILRSGESSDIVEEKFIEDRSGNSMEPASRFTQYK